MNHFPDFDSFIAHARLSLEAFHGQLLEEERLTDEDRRTYRVMLACLALRWLDRAGDVDALIELRRLIDEALASNQQLH